MNRSVGEISVEFVRAEQGRYIRGEFTVQVTSDIGEEYGGPQFAKVAKEIKRLTRLVNHAIGFDL